MRVKVVFNRKTRELEFKGRTVADLLDKCEETFNTSVSCHYYELELSENQILKDDITLRLLRNENPTEVYNDAVL
jgi:hypothetical protein